MKILIVNTYDTIGGAARSAYRLHRALLSQNVDSKMLVQDKRSDDNSVIVSQSKFQKVLSILRAKLDNLPVLLLYGKTETLFSPSWLTSKKLVNRINEINPDIVHLHWVNFGMLKIEELTKIKPPIVWSLHDNWLFTGGCHIKWECEKYKISCGKCPRIRSENENDLSRKIWRRKQKTLSKLNNLTIVGLSKWLINCSQESSLLKGKSHVKLPNPIDTTIFKPFDKKKSKEFWNLPTSKKLVLFGAIKATSDKNKGFKELSEALYNLANKNIELVIFGSKEPKHSPKFGFKTYYLDHIDNDVNLVRLYSAADVMIVPSLQETFGQTASESMSCGTPVVAFGHTGLLDIIDHMKNGYLAKPYNTSELAYGIEWVLENENYDQLCQNAREKVLIEFDSKVVVKKYLKLYKEITKKVKIN